MQTSTKVLLGVLGLTAVGIITAVAVSQHTTAKAAAQSAAMPPTGKGFLVETDTSDYSGPLSIAINQGIDFYLAGENASTGASWQMTQSTFAGGVQIFDKGAQNTSGTLLHHFLVLAAQPSSGTITFALVLPDGTVVKSIAVTIVVTPSVAQITTGPNLHVHV